MKSYLTILIIAGGLALGVPSCKERFEPPILQANPYLLVVDGFLNNGPDSSFIRLSRTKRLEDGVWNAAEPNAQLSVEDAAGNTLYYFNEVNGTGTYAVPAMSLSPETHYRLRIHTANGKRYLSDELIVKSNPPIDSISWTKLEEGVMIYANTHDPQKNTTYYRWDFTESWEYHSPYVSLLKAVGPSVYRTTEEMVYSCWTTQNSTDLLLGSSAKLSEDIIYKFPLRLLPANGLELSVRYSIMVRQYSLTRETFDYLQNLKKITEQMGSIFDAQPSQLSGNIRCLDDENEPVLGYMTATTLRSQRIWIDRDDVEPWGYRLYCRPLYPVTEDSLGFYFGSGLLFPVDELRAPDGSPLVNGAEPICADCTLRGGTTTKPDFWP